MWHNYRYTKNFVDLQVFFTMQLRLDAVILIKLYRPMLLAWLNLKGTFCVIPIHMDIVILL